MAILGDFWFFSLVWHIQTFVCERPPLGPPDAPPIAAPLADRGAGCLRHASGKQSVPQAWILGLSDLRWFWAFLLMTDELRLLPGD